jgi:hypothetical protein
MRLLYSLAKDRTSLSPLLPLFALAKASLGFNPTAVICTGLSRKQVLGDVTKNKPFSAIGERMDLPR